MAGTSKVHTEESTIEVQRQTDSAFGAPDDQVITDLVKVALTRKGAEHQGITVRLVESNEIRRSNEQWRQIDKVTNVLSFPADFPLETGIDYLGDLLICPEVLQSESVAQNKALADHWAHIVIHGVLHLLGYCLLYTSPSPRDATLSRMPSSA